MRTIVLTRLLETDHGTIGRLDGQWFTLENRWRDNQRNVSCIPAGEYMMRPARFNRGGYNTWAIGDVPGRSHILFHVGNTEDDTLGCPLIGTRIGVVAGKIAILQSRVAFDQFTAELAGEREVRLVIEAPPG